MVFVEVNQTLGKKNKKINDYYASSNPADLNN